MCRVRRFRCGFRMQFAVGWWRLTLQFPPRQRLWWLILVPSGMLCGYVGSLPLVAYLFERLNIDYSGWVQTTLEVYYFPMIALMENSPALTALFEASVELLKILFGE